MTEPLTDKYGRELVFVGDFSYPAGKPNRAERRAAGVRHPLKFIEAYRDLLEELQLEEGYGTESSLEALGIPDSE